MQCAFIVLNLFLLTHDVFSAMTEKQMNAAKKLVRNTCINKAKPTTEQVDATQKGDFAQDKNLQIRKDNTFDWESGVKALEANAPPNIAGPGVQSIANCKDAVKTVDDKCIASYEIAKCLYTDNPANYFLP